MQYLFFSKNNLYFSISTSVVFEGIIIGSPQINLHLENGYVIKKESHDLRLKFLLDANPKEVWELVNL